MKNFKSFESVQSNVSSDNESNQEARLDKFIAWSSLLGSIALGSGVYVANRQPLLSTAATGVSYFCSMVALHALKSTDHTLGNHNNFNARDVNSTDGSNKEI